jgi:hypothetical protein
MTMTASTAPQHKAVFTPHWNMLGGSLSVIASLGKENLLKEWAVS